MKRSLVAAGCILCLATAVAADVNRVILRVNDRIVTYYDYQRRLSERLAALQEAEIDPQQKRRLLDSAAEDTMRELLDEQLLLSKADQVELEIPDSEGQFEIEGAGAHRDAWISNVDAGRRRRQPLIVVLPGGQVVVWTIQIDDGTCHVDEGFADHAHVRYTADARDWTLLALGLTDDREAYEQGRLIKDGAGGSMAWYFYQPSNPRRHNGGNEP